MQSEMEALIERLGALRQAVHRSIERDAAAVCASGWLRSHAHFHIADTAFRSGKGVAANRTTAPHSHTVATGLASI